MIKRYFLTLTILIFAAAGISAQITIKMPKINAPTPAKQRTEPVTRPKTNNGARMPGSVSMNSSKRQMVMDDGVTFFDAEPVKEYDTKLRLNRDIGWKMKATLRILGTFPNRSAFKLMVMKNGSALATIRCEGRVYTKANDSSLRTPMQREGKDLSFEDFMTSGFGCDGKNEVIREIGNLAVDVYFIDGDTDAESLVRTYKIDVHKATKVRGGPTNSVADVADYYIQRHAEQAVAIAYFHAGNSGDYFVDPVVTSGKTNSSVLTIYTTYSPAEGSLNSINSFARCSVNGQKIKIERDGVTIKEDQRRQEIGIYTDRKTARYKTQGTPYKDWVEFVGLNFQLPIYTGIAPNTSQARLEDHPGKWECSIINNGVTYRTFRWEVANGKIVPHGEQKNGNVNLFDQAAIVDMEIPPAGSPIDHRLIPMPNTGLFYGIPWTTADGKAMANRIPTKGEPYHVPSTKARN